MKLIHAPQYSVRLIASPLEEVEPLSEILIDGSPSGKVIAGAILESALIWNELTLLFLTNDIPFEDTLHIYLLDDQLNMLDSARMFWMYSTGTFSDLDLTQPDIVRFHFFGGTVWTLTLLHEKSFMLPLVSEPRGVWRRLGFFRRFRLSGKPLPDTGHEEDHELPTISTSDVTRKKNVRRD